MLRISFVAIALLGLSRPTHAQSQAPDPIAGPRAARLVWRPEWRRADALDYTLIGVATAGALTVSFVPPPERDAHWRGPILFDRWLRDGLLANTASGRNTAATISDLAQWGSIAHVVGDATLVAMLADRSPEVGWQMLVMDAESYSVAVLLNAITKRALARARPDADACAKSPSYDQGCNAAKPNESFYSGHATVTATSAGLICVQHSELSLYGGAWDSAACATGIALTSLTGALRIVADRHWASDVITGHLLGFSAGYFLPQLLHFRPTPAGPQGASLLGVLPAPSEGGFSLLAVGRF